MADQRYSSKRKYDDPSPQPRRTRIYGRPLPASTPAGGAPASPSSHNVPPPRARADVLLMAGEVNPPSVDKDLVGAGGSLGGSSLGFSSSAGGDVLMKASSQHGYCTPHPEANWNSPGSWPHANSYPPGTFHTGFANQYVGPSYTVPNKDQSYYQQSNYRDAYGYTAYQNQWQTHSTAASDYYNYHLNSPAAYEYSTYQNQQHSMRTQQQLGNNPNAPSHASEPCAAEFRYVAPQNFQPQLHSGYGQVAYAFGHHNDSQPGYGVPPPCPETTWQFGQQQSPNELCGPSASTYAASSAPPAHDTSYAYKIDKKTLDKAMSGSECTKLGAGAFGEVYKVRLDGKDVAVKFLNDSCPTLKEQKLVSRQFNAEIKVLTKVHHTNLVQLVAACEERLAIVYDYMPNGNLLDKILTLGRDFKWRNRIEAAIDICKALIYMHERPHPIVHGDVSPGNILFDNKNVARLSDFGLSRTLELTSSGKIAYDTKNTPMGTPGYVDPDYQLTRRLTKSCDQYSFGVILLTLVTGEVDENLKKIVQEKLMDGPFWKVKDKKVTRKALKNIGVIQKHLHVPTKNLLDALEMLKLGLRLCGHKRPSLTEVLADLISYAGNISDEGREEPL